MSNKESSLYESYSDYEYDYDYSYTDEEKNRLDNLIEETDPNSLMQDHTAPVEPLGPCVPEEESFSQAIEFVLSIVA